VRNVTGLLCVCAVVLVSFTIKAEPAVEEAKPVLQIAILLDTSGSMRGLIDQAKSQLWKVVNEFATATQNGRHVELQVALYEYGNSRLSAEEGYIRLILTLTNDLDKVSEELFALTTNGGQEYCGMVIGDANEALDWSDSTGTLKAIFIAGNEPFTQGGTDYHETCKAAIEKGIVINTIFCGPHEEGIRTSWKDGAVLADGQYMNIDQDRQAVHIDAPQDKEIAELGAQLNETYLAYGKAGMAGRARQEAQDANASAASVGSSVERSVAKASMQYNNAAWDLVDAVEQGTVKLEEIEEEDLPEALRTMSQDERKAYLEAKAKDRASTQTKINELNEARKKYIAEEMKKLSESGEDTFDSAMVKALREQAAKKNVDLE